MMDVNGNEQPRADEEHLESRLAERERECVRLARRAEELERRLQRYTYGAEIASVALWEVDVEAGRVWWSSGYDTLFGERPPETAESWRWWTEHLHPDDADRVLESLEGAIASDATTWREEYRYRTNDGRYLSIVDRARILRVPGRTVVIGAMLDVSEQVRSLEELSKNTRLLRRARHSGDLSSRIIHEMSDGVIVSNSQGEFIVYNPAAERILGLAPVSGGPDAWSAEYGLFRIDETTPYPSHELPLARALRGECVEGERMFCRNDSVPDGGYLSVDAWPVLLQGNEHGGVVIFRDVTRETRMTAERDRVQAELAQAQKLESLGQLAAGIAHEINTPTQYVGDNVEFLTESFEGLLKSVSAIADLAEGDEPVPAAVLRSLLEEADLAYVAEEAPVALEQSADGIRRISEIVRAMKAFSHPAAERRSVDLNDAIRNTVTVARNEWKYVATVELELERELPMVTCSIGEINQAVLNIVVNAAHAIGDGVERGERDRGVITIRSHADEEYVTVEIEDDGPGIPEQVRSRIFDPFFTTKEVGKGTGQGLAIAYSVVVDKHAGTLAVESEPDRGARFILRLPLALEPAPVGG